MIPSDELDLCRRLRELSACAHDDHSIGEEAAEAIERLRADLAAAVKERESFEHSTIRQSVQIQELRADLAAAREALAASKPACQRCGEPIIGGTCRNLDCKEFHAQASKGEKGEST